SEPKRAREYYAEAVRLDPSNIDGMLWHAWYQAAAGQLSEAESAYRRVIASAKPGSGDWANYWARLGIGDISVAHGDLRAAEAATRAAGGLADRLSKSDPGNADWQRDLSVSYEKVGNVQVAQGDLTGALKSYRDSLAIRDRLSKSDPGNADWQRDLSVSLNKVGDVQVAQGDLSCAERADGENRSIPHRLRKSQS